MSEPTYIVRNYRPADFNRFVKLNVEAGNMGLTGHLVSPQVIAEHLGRPGYSPEQDLFVVEVAGDIVGYMDITPEPDIGRIILDCWVYPHHSGKGLATQLFNYAACRGKELGARVAQLNILEDNAAAKNMLSVLGFKIVRRFLKLRVDMVKVRWQNPASVGVQLRQLKGGEEHRLAEIQNRCFAGTWGYNPNTVEEIVYYINLRHYSPEDVVLALAGDEIIGYCWTRTTSGPASGERGGQIFMIGVDPDYRGRGVGKKVLLAGLSYLESKGCHGAELTVDSRNKVARALYRSVGFKIRENSLWYEKVIA